MKEVFLNLAIKLATQDVNSIIDSGTHLTRETYKHGRLKGVYDDNGITFYNKQTKLFTTLDRNKAIEYLSKLIFNQP